MALCCCIQPIFANSSHGHMCNRQAQNFFVNGDRRNLHIAKNPMRHSFAAPKPRITLHPPRLIECTQQSSRWVDHCLCVSYIHFYRRTWRKNLFEHRTGSNVMVQTPKRKCIFGKCMNILICTLEFCQR